MAQSKERLRRPVAAVTRSVVALAVVLSGVLVMWMLIASRTEAARVDPDGASMVVVPVYQVERMGVQRPWQGYGRAEALQQARVPARVASVVEAVPEGIEAGVAVKAGQLLAVLDSDDFERQGDAERQEIARLDSELDRLVIEGDRLADRLRLLDEDLAIAQRQEDRLRDLSERNAANVADVERAERDRLMVARERLASQEGLEGLPSRRAGLEAARESARARLALAELSVERSRLVSPIDGVVSMHDLEVGESVTPGQVMAEVVDVSRIEVPVRLPASSRGTFSLGDEAVVVAASDASRRWVGRIARINPTDDGATRTLTAYVMVEQQGADASAATTLTPGLFVSVEVPGLRTEGDLVIPRRAVRAGRVFVVEDGGLVSRAVSVRYTLKEVLAGLPFAEWVVLGEESGLSEGELVVSESTALLRDGVRVETRAVEALAGVEP
ncbi:MAG: efflux RND transporter periplasmic adaptor subunit [Phycisphaeraceae bacterium]